VKFFHRRLAGFDATSNPEAILKSVRLDKIPVKYPHIAIHLP